jgi:DNA-binding GntR family transcriptional regulator
MSKIEYRTLNELAYAEIKKGLISGRFSPGQVLVIRSLAETYGISTTPVREALQRLVAERLLTMQPNRSIAVPALSADSFEELAKIRCALEGLSGELGAARIRPAQVNRLAAMLDDIDSAIERRDTRAYLALNQKFHFAIYEQAGQARLLQMIQDLWSEVGPFFNDLFGDEAFIARANDQHRAIVDGLRSGDAVAVRQAIVADITVAARSIEPRLAMRR